MSIITKVLSILSLKNISNDTRILSNDVIISVSVKANHAQIHAHETCSKPVKSQSTYRIREQTLHIQADCWLSIETHTQIFENNKTFHEYRAASDDHTNGIKLCNIL